MNTVQVVTTLRCHTGKEGFFTEGRAYSVVRETPWHFIIISDTGNVHHLSKVKRSRLRRDKRSKKVCYTDYFNKE